MFNSKKRNESKDRAKDKLTDYVERDLKRIRLTKRLYQETCGHCHGRRVMSNGKPCRNCGGAGRILRG